MAKREKVWIIWYEDAEGPGDKHVYMTDQSAKQRTAELLESIMDSVDGEWQAAEEQGQMDEFHHGLKTLSNDIRSTLTAGNVWDAMELWREFESEDEVGTINWFGTLKVEKSVLVK